MSILSKFFFFFFCGGGGRKSLSDYLTITELELRYIFFSTECNMSTSIFYFRYASIQPIRVCEAHSSCQTIPNKKKKFLPDYDSMKSKAGKALKFGLFTLPFLFSFSPKS